MTDLRASAHPGHTPQITLWLGAGILIALKCWMISGQFLDLHFAVHDDVLYIRRAAALLEGNGFGSFDSRTLAKYPGLSFWIAGMHFAGIPFLHSVHAILMLAALYFSLALRAAGASTAVALATLALILFNPITWSVDWVRVFREPLSTGLSLGLAASVLFLLRHAARGRRAWLHLGVLAAGFAFSVYLREEDRLLWLLLALTALAVTVTMHRAGALSAPGGRAFALACFCVPTLLAAVHGGALRAFAEHWYGMGIIHDLDEGEFPRMLAAIRSIESRKENRMVMVTQETLQSLRREVPQFAPVIDRLPPPGPATVSCKLHGVCTEWSNGWMPFWIKDAAFTAGLTPTQSQAQRYFQQIREAIEAACAQRRMHCAPKGDSLVPPMELRWSRAWFTEVSRIATMILLPRPEVGMSRHTAVGMPSELARELMAVTLSTHHVRIPSTNGLYENSENPVDSLQSRLEAIITLPVRYGTALLITLAIVLGLYRACTGPPHSWSAIEVSALVLGGYLLIRLAILGWVAVFMGPLDYRIALSSHILCVAFALPILAQQAILRRD
jgi:hypothetical protein